MAKMATKKKSDKRTAAQKRTVKDGASEKSAKKTTAKPAESTASANNSGRAEMKPAGHGGGEERLSEQLRKEVARQLLQWQAEPTRDGIRRMMFEIYQPGGNQLQLLAWSVARTRHFEELIRAARKNGELYPWIIPYPAAIAFESVFQMCTGMWLLADEPQQPDQLPPLVDDYINLQVRVFGLMVGS